MTTLPPESTIEVRISVAKSMWFDMVFIAGKQGRIVETSHTMWDIGDLFCWLEAIARGDPSAEMQVDREGMIDSVVARFVDEKRVHLVIRDGLNEPDIFLEAVVSRRKLVWEIYYELQKLALLIGRHYCPEKRETDPDWTRLPVVEKWLDWQGVDKPTG